jgi:hypothetical protein
MGTRDQHRPGNSQPPAHIPTDSPQFAPRVFCAHQLKIINNAHISYLSIEGYDFENPDTCHMQSWVEQNEIAREVEKSLITKWGHLIMICREGEFASSTFLRLGMTDASKNNL